MSKKRVYEIARERGLETRQVMRRLQQAGIEVKAAASTVSDDDIARVFGEDEVRESVSPAQQQGNLPSWLSPSASAAPKTTSKAALDKQKEERTQRRDAAKSAKAKALEQARLLKQQLAAKKAQAEAAAEAAEAARLAAAEAAAAEPAAEPEAEAPAAAIEEDTPSAQPVTTGSSGPATSIAEALAEAQAEAQAEAARPEPVPEPEPEPAAVAPEPEPVAAAPEQTPVDDEPDEPMSEAEMRRRAQQLAAQRVAEQAQRRRAQLEAEKLEEAQRAREKDKPLKKKDKKKKAEEPEEFIGSRRPRVGGASREPDADRGSRRGPGAGRKRRVIIDGGATRGRGGDGGGRGRGRGGRRGGRRDEVAAVDPTVPVTIHAGATVKELADALGVAATELIKVLMEAGDFVTITVSLSPEQIEIIGEGLEPPREIVVRSAADDEEIPEFDDPDDALVPRAPVVTIMGHVDHGKTSLLDAIREAKVAAGEAGGITQHIGAYQVEVPYEEGTRRVTFLDTPGHEAFTALRARGAKVTDEAVLVVAADDGVKPQTIEAIDHARAADVPIVVAVNKIDKENANVEKVMGELATHELQPVSWGGSTEVVQVSAKQRTNLDELIETILLQADVLELKANPNADASGYIIESKLDPGRGPVATMLVSRGTLKVGDVIVAGTASGKVRALLDFRGQRVQDATPAMPVEIHGFDSVPEAGEFCQVVENERVARDKAQKRAQRMKAELLAKRQRGLSLEDLFNRIKEGEVQDLNLVVKADAAGSIEAIEQELGKIEHPEVKVRIIRSGVGAITGNDIMLAAASRAIVLGFHVRPNSEARLSAEREGVDVRTYKIIYKLREDVENALSGMLSPEEVEETTGEAEVRQLFRASRIGTIAGCMVTQGVIERNSKVRVVRDGTVVYEGELSSLKRVKDDVREVAQGFECGLVVDGYNDLKEGDVIEAYTVKEVERDITRELAASGSQG